MRRLIKTWTAWFLAGLYCLALGACGNGGTYVVPQYGSSLSPPAETGIELAVDGDIVSGAITLVASESLSLEIRGAPAGSAAAWSTSNVSVAQILKPAQLKGINPGQASLRVLSSGQRLEFPIQVLPAGADEASPDPSPESPDPSPESPETPPQEPAEPESPGSEVPNPVPSDPFMDEVVEFLPGPHAGFGSENLPEVVLGGPQGKGYNQGGFDVLSLGVGGEIVLKSDSPIYNGPGPDFIIFENPFYIGGNPEAVYAELGEVSVSQNGVDFFTFVCAAEDRVGGYPGCAGLEPVLANVLTNTIDPTDPDTAGGDAFDLEDLGLSWVRYVRIQDLSNGGSGTNAGFDLDAVSIVHPDGLEND